MANPPPAGNGDKSDDKSRYGFYAVITGVVGIVILVLVSAWVLANTKVDATDLAAISGPPITAIAALVGAFFGVNLGQEGKKDAEKQKDTAKEKEKDASVKAARADALLQVVEHGASTDVVKRAREQMRAQNLL
jgi:hypothetical protein